MKTSIPTKDDFHNFNVNEPELIRLAGMYDVWDHRDPDAKALQFGLRALSPADFASIVAHNLNGRMEGDLRPIITSGYAIKSYMDNVNADYAKKSAYTARFEKLIFCVLNGGRNSDAVQPAAKPHHDALMAWRYDGKNVSVSLYHATGKEHYDLSEIAKKYNGGGHRGACGFSMPIGQFIGLGLDIDVEKML